MAKDPLTEYLMKAIAKGTGPSVAEILAAFREAAEKKPN